MTLRPLLTQLDNRTSTAGVDCSTMTIINALRWASNGVVGPHRKADIPLWVHLVRNAARNTQQGLLMRGDTLQAYTSVAIAHEFAKRGVHMPRVEYRQNIGWGTLLDRLRAGQFVHLAVDYGPLNDGPAPSGSLTFRGDHSLGIVDPYKHRGWLYGHIGDPLFDGRTRWINGRWYTYPKGWQGVRLIHYRTAAGRWGSNPPGPGHCTAIFLTRR